MRPGSARCIASSPPFQSSQNFFPRPGLLSLYTTTLEAEETQKFRISWMEEEARRYFLAKNFNMAPGSEAAKKDEEEEEEARKKQTVPPYSSFPHRGGGENKMRDAFPPSFPFTSMPNQV